MTAWKQADITKANRRHGNPPPRPPEPPPAPLTPAKEDKPATVAVLRRFQWQAASGLHAEQFPDRFKIVIIGPIEEQEAVEAALHALKNR